METLVPSRTQISDRFPIASFDVRVPESRFFEIACATDPRLFHTEYRGQRTQRNFFTTRDNGLLAAPRGCTTWLMPSEQLKRFAGAQRIYYALASYGGPTGADPHFSISPRALDQVPSVGLAPDFTGRTLDRTRLGQYEATPDAYGGKQSADLRWGGDDVLERERDDEGEDEVYDDGFDRSLWTGDGETEVGEGRIGTADGESARSYRGSEAALSAVGAALALATEDTEPEAEHEDDFDSAYSVEDETEGEEDAYLEDYEDPQGIYGAVAYHVQAPGRRGRGRTGAVALEDAPAATIPVSPAGAPSGKDSDYCDDEECEAPSLVPGLAAVVFDIPEQIRIMRVVGAAESGSDGYSAVNADTEFSDSRHKAFQKYHLGLSWGFVQFTQRSGAVGRVLQAVRRRELRTEERIPDAQQMPAIFGSAWQQLLDVTGAATPDARLAPVDGAELWKDPWPDRFAKAGALDHVRAAQNEIAITDYLEPVIPVAGWLGVSRPRGIAMLLDRCIHMGVRGGLRWVMETVGPVRTDGDRAAALQTLGYADLKSFQAGVEGLEADGKWGPRTHAAMVARLRELGASSPIPVPSPEEVLQALADGSAGRSFERRMRDLLKNQTDFDDTVQYALS